MRRINTTNKAANAFGPGKHGWKNGVPGTADRPTEGEADWFNSVQEEVAGAIEGSGAALDPDSNRQLLTAIRSLRGFTSAADHDAVGNGIADDTAALTAAQAAAAFVYLPMGKIYKVGGGLNYWQFFGPGQVIENGKQWDPNPYPQVGSVLRSYRERTFGNQENAVAATWSINSADGQTRANTQVLGTTTQGMAQTYNDRDHVGMYGQAFSYEPDVTSGATTYTVNTLTDASVVAALAAAGKLVRGMIIDTQHGTPYTGRIQSWAGNVITVDGWWQRATGAAGTPANGTGATINPNTKIWGMNVNLFLGGNAGNRQAQRGTGFELGLSNDPTTGGVGVWGFDVVTLAGKPEAHYRSRGSRTYGWFGSTGADFCFVADSCGVGFESRDSTSYDFKAMKANGIRWAVGSGVVARDWRAIKSVNANTAAGDDDVLFICAGAMTLTLPAAAGRAGRVYAMKAMSGTVIVGSAGGNIVPPNSTAGAATWAAPAGAQAEFVSDGAAWYAFS